MTKTVIEKFFEKVDRSDVQGCWEWMAYRTPFGYGNIRQPVLGERYAHRVSYKVRYGSLSKSDCVLHRCDNPSCVNPDHLFLGSRKENMEDRDRKGRYGNRQMYQTHCVRGHPFDEHNTRLRKNKDGGTSRICKVCVSLHKRAHLLKKKAVNGAS